MQIVKWAKGHESRGNKNRNILKYMFVCLSLEMLSTDWTTHPHNHLISTTHPHNHLISTTHPHNHLISTTHPHNHLISTTHPHNHLISTTQPHAHQPINRPTASTNQSMSFGRRWVGSQWCTCTCDRWRAVRRSARMPSPQTWSRT